MEFKGKTALVTGAARGIGQAACEALAKAGSRVAILDINGEGAEQAAASIRADGGDATAFRCDVSSDAEVAAMERDVCQHFGVPDILINNAYAQNLVPGTIDQVDIARWSQALDINVLGFVRMMNAFVPGMLERASGYVVTTSSALAILPNKAAQHMLPYITSKGALLGMSYGLAYSLRPRGVLTSLFCPGLTSAYDQKNTRAASLGFLDGVPEHLTKPATYKFAAEVLLEGMRREKFLISSEPDFEDSIVRFAQNRLDPLSSFH